MKFLLIFDYRVNSTHPSPPTKCARKTFVCGLGSPPGTPWRWRRPWHRRWWWSLFPPSPAWWPQVWWWRTGGLRCKREWVCAQCNKTNPEGNKVPLGYDINRTRTVLTEPRLERRWKMEGTRPQTKFFYCNICSHGNFLLASIQCTKKQKGK